MARVFILEEPRNNNFEWIPVRSWYSKFSLWTKYLSLRNPAMTILKNPCPGIVNIWWTKYLTLRNPEMTILKNPCPDIVNSLWTNYLTLRNPAMTILKNPCPGIVNIWWTEYLSLRDPEYTLTWTGLPRQDHCTQTTAPDCQVGPGIRREKGAAAGSCTCIYCNS